MKLPPLLGAPNENVVGVGDVDANGAGVVELKFRAGAEGLLMFVCALGAVEEDPRENENCPPVMLFECMAGGAAAEIAVVVEEEDEGGPPNEKVSAEESCLAGIDAAEDEDVVAA